jgi:5-methylthioadenosine/S-adenosylhomocysteine deaminase
MANGTRALVPEWIVPVCPENLVLEQHAVVLDNDRIAAIVPSADLEQSHPGIDIERLPGCALMPGLVNAHTHVAMVLMRGMADDLPLMRWLEDHIWPAEQQWVGPDYVRAGSELAIAEMLAGGTTCFNDNYFFPDVTAATAARAGMRAVIGIPIISLPTGLGANRGRVFQSRAGGAPGAALRAAGQHGVRPACPIHGQRPAFERMRDLAEEMDVPIHLHLLETAGEIDGSKASHGKHPLDRLDGLGMLGPRLLAVHMTQLNQATWIGSPGPGSTSCIARRRI